MSQFLMLSFFTSKIRDPFLASEATQDGKYKLG